MGEVVDVDGVAGVALAGEDSLATAVPPDSFAFFALFYETPASRTRPPFRRSPLSCSPEFAPPLPEAGFLGRG